MDYEKVIVEIGEKYVGVITLNRPDQLNTFDSAMAAELHDALRALDAEPAVRVILLKGSGKAFCAGIDVNEVAGKSTNELREWVERMERPLVAISTMKKPVIAQVNGVATANGMGILAAADLAIAAQNVRMGLTAINVGLNCVGPVIPVSKCVGRKKALELLFYGNLISAQEALTLGLINRIALKIAKSAYYKAEDMEYEKQFAYMNEAFARLCSTEDAKEGVQAFFDKRRPHWQEK